MANDLIETKSSGELLALKEQQVAPVEQGTKPSQETSTKAISSIQGQELGDEKYIALREGKVEDTEAIKQLLARDPGITTADEGNAYHARIQYESTTDGQYDNSEVTAKTAENGGETALREYEIKKGENQGKKVTEGTRYDLYKETNSKIYTNEIKPFSPSGIRAAEDKYIKQIDIEENGGANHGKDVIRNLTFYDPRDGHIVLSGSAEKTLNFAKELAKGWAKSG
jgi:hypothetical protein